MTLLLPFPVYTVKRDGFIITTDPARLDPTAVHRYLSLESYWAQGVSLESVARAMHHSLCFGLYQVTEPVTETAVWSQIGLARVMTDFTTFAYLADVYVLPAWQGQGLGQWLIGCLMAHPELQTIRRWTLYTRDAHTLYARFGFQVEPAPERHMVYRPEVQVSTPQVSSADFSRPT